MIIDYFKINFTIFYLKKDKWNTQKEEIYSILLFLSLMTLRVKKLKVYFFCPRVRDIYRQITKRGNRVGRCIRNAPTTYLATEAIKHASILNYLSWMRRNILFLRFQGKGNFHLRYRIPKWVNEMAISQWCETKWTKTLVVPLHITKHVHAAVLIPRKVIKQRDE